MRRDYMTARECALFSSSHHRMNRTPRSMVPAAIAADIMSAGYSEEEAFSAADKVWAEFWERPSVNDE